MVASSRQAETQTIAHLAGFWARGLEVYGARCMRVLLCSFLHDEAIHTSCFGILWSYICTRSTTSDSFIEAVTAVDFLIIESIELPSVTTRLLPKLPTKSVNSQKNNPCQNLMTDPNCGVRVTPDALKPLVSKRHKQTAGEALSHKP